MSFRGRKVPRVHEQNDTASKVNTIDSTQRLLRILLKEICDCPHKQQHIDGLRQSLIEDDIIESASEELEHQARMGLIK